MGVRFPPGPFLTQELPYKVQELLKRSQNSLEQLTVTFTYTNWKGEVGVRSVIPVNIDFEENEYHKPKQWLLHGYDLDKKAMRTYALKDTSDWKEARNI